MGKELNIIPKVIFLYFFGWLLYFSSISYLYHPLSFFLLRQIKIREVSETII